MSETEDALARLCEIQRIELTKTRIELKEVKEELELIKLQNKECTCSGHVSVESHSLDECDRCKRIRELS
jgi:hypothetical protein